MTKLAVISIDGHVKAPRAGYRDYVEARHLDAFDAWLAAMGDTPDAGNKSPRLPDESQWDSDLRLRDLEEQLERHLELASEAELSQLFRDCEVGALPPVGAAFGIPTVVDDSLMNAPDVWFEAGDHEDLVHMRGIEFLSLFTGARHGRFSRHA